MHRQSLIPQNIHTREPGSCVYATCRTSISHESAHLFRLMPKSWLHTLMFLFHYPRLFRNRSKRVDAKVFRASVPVCSGGMLSVCADQATGAVYCGGGNGIIRKVGRFVCLAPGAVRYKGRPWSLVVWRYGGLNASCKYGFIRCR